MGKWLDFFFHEFTKFNTNGDVTCHMAELTKNLITGSTTLSGRVTLRFIGSPAIFLASLRYGKLVAAVTSFTVIKHQASGVVGCALSD